MIGRYKNTIIELKSLLNELEEDIFRIDLIKKIQNIIVKKVKHIESKIQNNKKQNNIKRIESYRCVLKIVKSFADAIACLYISKYNLKQLTFNLENGDFKQHAGFISDKEGFNFEFSVANDILSKNIPCILSDITNNLRYGDIVLLNGSDPSIIECKKSINANKRVRKQGEKLKKLSTFYLNDLKEMKYGLMKVKRKEIEKNEKNYQKIIDDLLTNVKDEKCILMEVEKGLYYQIIDLHIAKSDDLIFPNNVKPIVFQVNSSFWCNVYDSYTPLSLQIKDPVNLYRVLKGEVLINVILDEKIIKSIASKMKYKFEFNESSDYPLNFYKLTKNKTAESFFAISRHMFQRIAYEFVSVDWMINNLEKTFRSDNGI